MIKSRNIAPKAVKASNLDIEEVIVTVDATETAGTATVAADSIVLGFVPTAQDQMIESVAISGTTLTITLAAAATADNTFVVKLLK